MASSHGCWDVPVTLSLSHMVREKREASLAVLIVHWSVAWDISMLGSCSKSFRLSSCVFKYLGLGPKPSRFTKRGPKRSELLSDYIAIISAISCVSLFSLGPSAMTQRETRPNSGSPAPLPTSWSSADLSRRRPHPHLAIATRWHDRLPGRPADSDFRAAARATEVLALRPDHLAPIRLSWITGLASTMS